MKILKLEVTSFQFLIFSSNPVADFLNIIFIFQRLVLFQRYVYHGRRRCLTFPGPGWLESLDIGSAFNIGPIMATTFFVVFILFFFNDFIYFSWMPMQLSKVERIFYPHFQSLQHLQLTWKCRQLRTERKVRILKACIIKRGSLRIQHGERVKERKWFHYVELCRGVARIYRAWGKPQFCTPGILLIPWKILVLM